jgi:hypothetical protein
MPRNKGKPTRTRFGHNGKVQKVVTSTMEALPLDWLRCFPLRIKFKYLGVDILTCTKSSFNHYLNFLTLDCK